MSMCMQVASVHHIEHTEVGVNGYDDCQNFIDRLNDYADELGEEHSRAGDCGEGFMDFEIPISSLEEIVKQDDEWFAEIGCVADKAIIQKLYENADKNDPTGYAFINCF